MATKKMSKKHAIHIINKIEAIIIDSAEWARLSSHWTKKDEKEFQDKIIAINYAIDSINKEM